MASTVQSPPPAPPLRPRPPRSFAGPVVLIVIGVFFLLANMGVIEWHNFGYWFSHYWPVLLILWGFVKLLEYQQATRGGYRAPGIGAGGVVLIVFLVLAGLSATGMYRHWDEFGEAFHWNGNDMPWWGHSYNYTDDFQQAFPTGGSLHVNSERGAINVSASDDHQIHIAVHKRINAERQEDADRWNGSTRPQISTTGQVVTINSNTRGAGDHWVSTDLDISLPRKAGVVLSTRHGDISIMGRDGNADIKSAEGDVSITDLNGSLTLNLDGSSARISQVSSDVTIQGRANDVSLEDIKGAVRLDGDFMESVKLSRIAKPVSFKTSRTDMDFTRLDGDLTLDSGDLEATNVSGPLRLHTRSKDIMLNGVTNDVHLQNENGAVEVHLNKLGSLEVTNSKGDIRVFVPQKAGFTVDAQARDGEIQSDFNSLKIDNGDSRGAATGTVNGGGPRMVLNDEHGTIEIHAGDVVSQAVPNAAHPPRTPDAPQATEN
jgi:putative adhesin/cell wall-active antibiotic response 4TMS protein YvqF